MNIELKNIKIAEHLSEETTAFTADIFVNGKKVGYARNDGRGGCTDYNRYPGDGNMEVIKQAEEFCKTLPQKVYPPMFGQPELRIDMNLEEFIDDIIEKKLLEKANAKLKKKMVDHLMWGVPNTGSYTQIKFKKPLNQVPTDLLQKYVDNNKKDFTEGVVFLNTNLEELGIKI